MHRTRMTTTLICENETENIKMSKTPGTDFVRCRYGLGTANVPVKCKNKNNGITLVSVKNDRIFTESLSE